MKTQIEEILNRKFVAGTRVTNCVVHMARSWDNRPQECQLCWADLGNHIAYCHRVNDFLNRAIDDVRAVLQQEVPR